LLVQQHQFQHDAVADVVVLAVAKQATVEHKTVAKTAHADLKTTAKLVIVHEVDAQMVDVESDHLHSLLF